VRPGLDPHSACFEKYAVIQEARYLHARADARDGSPGHERVRVRRERKEDVAGRRDKRQDVAARCHGLIIETIRAEAVFAPPSIACGLEGA
jgi:hypothetical protein